MTVLRIFRQCTGTLLLFAVVLALAAPMFAKRDPLTPAEVDQVRDAAQQPEKRVLLYVKFIRTRATELEQLRSDPRFSPDRVAKVHNLLHDITALLDEMDDNLDQYVDRKADLRKALKDVIALDSDLQSNLHAFQSTGLADTSQNSNSYAFVLHSAMDAAGDSLEHAQHLQQEQQELWKSRKKR